MKRIAKEEPKSTLEVRLTQTRALAAIMADSAEADGNQHLQNSAWALETLLEQAEEADGTERPTEPGT